MAGVDSNPSGWRARLHPYRRRLQALMTTRKREIGLLATLLTVLASSGVLGYLIYRERAVLFTYHWRIRPAALGLAIALHPITILLATANWAAILNRLGKPLPFIRHYRNFCISNAARRLPGTVWYIASRATFYQQEGIDARLTSLASGVEYALVTLTGLILGGVFSMSILAAYHVSPWLMAAALAVILFLVRPQTIAWLFRILRVEAGQFRLGDLARWMGGFSLSWLLGGLMLFLVANILTPLPLSQLPYVMGSYLAVIMVTRLLIFSPSNMGITEIGFSLLLTTVMPAPVAVVTAVLLRVLATLMDIVHAGVWLLLPQAGQSTAGE